MSDSPTKEETSQTIDWDYALKVLHLPQTDEAGSKRRKKKKHRSDLTELALAKKLNLQQQAQDMI
jgi:hypothetical protein